MKLLILGGSGMLGHKLLQRLSDDLEVYASVRDDGKHIVELGIAALRQIVPGIDVRDDAALRSVISTLRPDAVVNAVGVIKQLPSSNDLINTLTINSILPHRLGLLSREFGFRFITISTDCVFSGTKGNYSEGDPADALDLYGRSKNLGEVTDGNCLTVRSSIIGREVSTSHSLVEWFLGNRGGRVKGFANAIYSGFPTIVFADIIGNLLLGHPELNGLYHISSEPIDKFRLLTLVNKTFDAGITIERDEAFTIDRSLNSTLFRAATGLTPPAWEVMIERMASDPTPYDAWRK
jgi:dTDP-4-dehydrorhamnose reductase